jgi:hypothetical protein
VPERRCPHGYLPTAPRCPYGCALNNPHRRAPRLDLRVDRAERALSMNLGAARQRARYAQRQKEQ